MTAPDSSDALARASTPDDLNRAGAARLPGHLGIRIVRAAEGTVEGEFEVAECLMAPNGFLHAGSIVTLADTCAGYGCILSLPPGANGFTTVELKSNHLGTTREGRVSCEAVAVHRGRTTQVWDATVRHVESGRVLALFRCTQMVLYPKAREGGAPA
ncbi:MAG: PaaI family thioesterase [Rubrivivax sp.]